MSPKARKKSSSGKQSRRGRPPKKRGLKVFSRAVETDEDDDDLTEEEEEEDDDTAADLDEEEDEEINVEGESTGAASFSADDGDESASEGIESEEEEEAQSEPFSSPNSPSQVSPDQGGLDIIEEFAVPTARSGRPVYLWVHKDGVTMGRRNLPYSLDQLQKEFGSGVFVLYVKDAVNHQVLKRQTIPMGLGLTSQTAAAPVVAPASPAQGLGANEVLAMMQEERLRTEERLKDDGKRDKDVFATLMGTLMQNQVAQGAQTQQFMQMMSQTQMQMMEKISASSREMFLLIQKQIETLSTRQAEKPMSALELLALMDKQKNAGIEQYESMMRRIEERSDRDSELIETIKALKEPADKEKPSSFDRMIEVLGPVVAQVVAAQAAQGGTAAQPAQALPSTEAAPPAQRTTEVRQPSPRSPQGSPQVFTTPAGLPPPPVRSRAPGFPVVEPKAAPREVPATVLPSAGLPSAGLPSAGLPKPSAGLPSAGLPSAGLPNGKDHGPRPLEVVPPRPEPVKAPTEASHETQ